MLVEEWKFQTGFGFGEKFVYFAHNVENFV